MPVHLSQTFKSYLNLIFCAKFNHKNLLKIFEMESEKKFVIKRDGTQAEIKEERIKERLAGLCKGLNMDYVNLDIITGKVFKGIYSGIKTAELDTLSAETCAYMNLVHPDYSRLASRIEVSNLHKETEDDYVKVVEKLTTMVDK